MNQVPGPSRGQRLQDLRSQSTNDVQVLGAPLVRRAFVQDVLCLIMGEQAGREAAGNLEGQAREVADSAARGTRGTRTQGG